MKKTTGSEFADFVGLLRNILVPAARPGFVYLLILVVTGALLSVGGPLLLKLSVDHLSLTSSDSARQAAAVLVSAYVAVLWLEKMLKECKAALYVRVEQSIQRALIDHVLSAIIGRELKADTGINAGPAQEDLSNGLIGFRILLSNYTLTLIPVVLQFFVMLGVFFFVYGAEYFLIMLVAFTVYTLLFFRSTLKLQALQKEALKYRNCAGSKMADALLNIEAVKAFGLEGGVVKGVDLQMAEAETLWSKFSRKRLFYSVAQISVMVVALSSVLGIAFFQVSGGEVTAGGLVLLIFYLTSIVQPIESLSLSYKEIKQGEILFFSLFKYLEPAEKNQSLPDIILPDVSAPTLEFLGVSFNHANRQSILSDVSFSIRGGSLTAVVGASGSGKTTLSRLLMGFYEPSSGEILMNGLNLSTFSAASLRRVITWVPQHTTLFDDSAFFNVWVGDIDRPASAVSSAIDAAYASSFLMKLPEGTDSNLGRRGHQLSGGEKQRIAIARAYLRGSRIIVFDEATSALDAVNERLFFTRLKSDFTALTRIVITHKLEAVVDAEQIIVMSGGRVVEMGTHAELLSLMGEYSRLWDSRLGLKKELIA